jgi:hypothetical protein
MSTTITTMPSPEQAFEMYRPLVEGNEQAIPILLYGGAEAIAPVAITQVPDGGIQPVLNAVIPRLKETLGSAEWLLLSAESWFRTLEADEVMQVQPGQLAAEHEAGDAKVKECVSITGVAANGQCWSYVRQFERVGSQVIWGEPHVSDTSQGGVPDILLHAVR